VKKIIEDEQEKVAFSTCDALRVSERNKEKIGAVTKNI